MTWFRHIQCYDLLGHYMSWLLLKWISEKMDTRM